MARLHSLRARVAPYFAAFGTLLSVVMAVMVYQSAHDLSVRLIDETLTAELDDYIAHWFWIDDRDMLSKRLFSFLFFIFTLVETGGKETPTVLTIPAG